MKERMIVLAVLSVLFLMIGIAFASQNNGAEKIDLDGGSKGAIDFPHHLHQTALGDCNACHDVFSKQTGIIKSLKEQNKLEKKQVMNKTCIKCHRDMAKAGDKSGPTGCSKCHTK